MTGNPREGSPASKKAPAWKTSCSSTTLRSLRRVRRSVGLEVGVELGQLVEEAAERLRIADPGAHVDEAVQVRRREAPAGVGRPAGVVRDLPAGKGGRVEAARMDQR